MSEPRKTTAWVKTVDVSEWRSDQIGELHTRIRIGESVEGFHQATMGSPSWQEQRKV